MTYHQDNSVGGDATEVNSASVQRDSKPENIVLRHDGIVKCRAPLRTASALWPIGSGPTRLFDNLRGDVEFKRLVPEMQ